MNKVAVGLGCVLAWGWCSMAARSDEGMWLLNEPPRAKLREAYQFELTDAWLERAMRASVRFNNGGSGAVVSPEGLVVTNHHIAADALQKLSTAGRDLYRNGYLARTRAEELRCPDLELNILQSIEDVTQRVESAVPKDLDLAAAFAARREVMARIEKESLDRTGLRSDVVTLYHGGAYHLYRYRKFTDVRLVCAPEAEAAAFGGDVDNFEYPRFGFDVAFFRIYDQDQPARWPHWLRWSRTDPVEGDLVFVTGHPGTTNRLETLAKLVHRRDKTLPYQLTRLRSAEAALAQFSQRGPDEARWAANDLHRVANARKAFAGQYQGLLDPAILARKQREEQALKDAESSRATPAKSNPWEAIAKAQAVLDPIEREYFLLERGDAFASELFTLARHLLRWSAEKAKPSGSRLREYRDSNLESLKLQLFSPAPIHPELERARLMQSLTFLAEQLGGNHPVVRTALAGKNPEQRAAELVAGCRLAEVRERQNLFEAQAETLASHGDPLIALARAVDPEARRIRLRYETEVDEVERQAYAQIAQARFRQLGRSVAPDATFTLRLAYGTVRGYEAEGSAIPFFTTFQGAWDRARKQGFREPFALPERWRPGSIGVPGSTPLNFVSTADTIGGNSGSPVLNRAGELVGINFDRNRPGLVRNFVYTDVQARHIAVHGRAVLEVLNRLMRADSLTHELLGETATGPDTGTRPGTGTGRE